MTLSFEVVFVAIIYISVFDAKGITVPKDEMTRHHMAFVNESDCKRHLPTIRREMAAVLPSIATIYNVRCRPLKVMQ